MKVLSKISLVLCLFLVSCNRSCNEYDQDYYILNCTSESLYIYEKPGLSAYTNGTEDYEYAFLKPNMSYKITIVNTFFENGMSLIILRPETMAELKEAHFEKDIYDKKLFIPYWRLEANGFVIRIYDKDLE